MAQVSYGTITITDTTDLTTYIRYATKAPLTAASQFQETPTTNTRYIAVLSIPASDPIPAWNSSSWKWLEFIGTDGVSVLGTREIYYLKTNSATVAAPANGSDISQASANVKNQWTKSVPTYVTNGEYWTCIQTHLDGSPTWVYGSPVLNQSLTDMNHDIDVMKSVTQQSVEDSQGAMSQANNGIKEIYRVWYRTNSGATLSKPSTHVTETRNDINNTWTKVKPIENSDYRYYFYCEETITNGGVSSWTNPVLDITTLSKYEVEALDSRTKTFFFPGDSSYPGAYVVGKNSDDGLRQDDISTYGFNTRVTTTGISIGYNEAKVLHLKTTPSPASLDFYKPPTISGNTVEEGELAASLSATGLILSKGGVKAGTPNQSGFIYLSTEPYGSYSVNGSSGISDWKEIIGTKFGVTSDGTLYADGANITNINANNISTNLLSAIQAKVTTLSTITANMGTLTAGTISYGTTGNNNSFYLSANSSKTATIAGASRSSLRLTVGSGFGVDVDGKLYATGADIGGAIKAQSLTIESNATINDTSGLIRNDAVEVGGRNLLYNSGTMPAVSSGNKGWRASGGTVSHIDISTPPIAGISGGIRCTNTGSSAARIGIAQDLLANRFIAGKKYSMGCWIRASAEFSSDVAIQPIWISSSQTTNSKYISMTLNTNWQYISAEGLTLAGDQASSYSAGYVYASNVPAGGYIEVCGIMLEEGTKCISWTPAPEDVASDIEDASKVADNYLKFEPNKGLMVADQTNGIQTIDATTQRNVLIDSDSVDIRNGQNVLGKFGLYTTVDDQGTTSYKNGVQIGKQDESHMDLDYHSMQLKDKGKRTYFYVSDLRDVDGYAAARARFRGNGERTIFETPVAINTDATRLCTVTVDHVVQTDPSDYTVTGGGEPSFIEFTTAPVDGADIVLDYWTRDYEAKAYTLGIRKEGSIVGLMSVAEGYGATASGFRSHAEGSRVTSSGDSSHAEGAVTQALGEASHAEGYVTTASGHSSHAEGYETEATMDGTHAEGYQTTASGHSSHAEGHTTIASGDFSHAEGFATTASGRSSHTGGIYTVAGYSYQTVIGKYNSNKSNTAFEIGNGSDTFDNKRSNALTVDWDGNLWTAGHYTSAITACGATGTADLVLSTSEKKVNLNSNRAKVGADLTNNSGGVKCAKSGYVEVSGNIYFLTGFDANDYVHLVIKRGSTTIINAVHRIPNDYDYFSVAPIVYSVSAGDILYLYAYNQSGARGKINAATGSWLTVKYL